jgi:transcriptional regulator with XRE-family HTH domain
MSDVGELLDAVGPRLRALRQQRDLTLTALSAETGIGVSTLSRLETGQRRPTLELLLPLARAHGVPLDEIVDAPETGDPRVHLKPVVRGGRTFLPLTRRPGGVQAYKIVMPPDDPKAPQTPRVHEGYEWLYVLAGRLTLVLGRQVLDLKPGEVVEFDTRTPHVLANYGNRPVELLGLFGPQGERMHVRAER